MEVRFTTESWRRSPWVSRGGIRESKGLTERVLQPTTSFISVERKKEVFDRDRHDRGKVSSLL
jgi:hypothetical protein